MAVSPAAAAGSVLFGKILGVVDEDVGAFGQLAHGLVESGVAGFVIGGVDQHSFFSLQTKSHAALGMVQPRGFNAITVGHGQASIVDVVEIELRPHLVKIDGKIRRSHLLGHDLLQAASAAGRVKD